MQFRVLVLEILFGALGVLRWKDSGAIETHISSYTRIVKNDRYAVAWRRGIHKFVSAL